MTEKINRKEFKEMIKRMFKSLGQKIKSIPGAMKTKIAGVGTGLVAAAAEMDANVQNAMADPRKGGPTTNPSLGSIGTNDGASIVKNTIGTITQLAIYAGIFLLVIGLIMLFMGFKNEDAEAKHRAGLVILAGVGLVAIRAIVSNVTGVDAGSTGATPGHN